MSVRAALAASRQGFVFDALGEIGCLLCVVSIESALCFVSHLLRRGAALFNECQVFISFEHRDSVLVNNAGIGIYSPFAETSEKQFDELMKTHLKGPFFLTQRLLPLIRDGGRIVNISTGLARFTLPGYAAYAAMKGGIEVLTRYMAKELGARRITVNVLAPGAIETDFAGGVVRDNKEVNKFLASQTALGRVGLPDDIGGAVASLLADDNHWITRQRIEASRGMFLLDGESPTLRARMEDTKTGETHVLGEAEAIFHD